MSVRLVCIDVDGTLVGSGGRVHPSAWDAAAKARAAGVRLAICSGRPGFGDALAYAQRLDANGWHVFQNGASVLNLASGLSRSTPLPPATVEMLLGRARAVNRLIELYTDDDYAWEGPPERARGHAGLLGVPFRERPVAGLRGTIVRAQWIVAMDETERVTGEPHPGLEVSPSSSPVMPDTRFVNLTVAGVDKSTAVRTVAAEYGIPLADVMYVGDAPNDVPALRIVGHPVAVGNAEPEAREAAARLVAGVDEGGLAEALRDCLAG